MNGIFAPILYDLLYSITTKLLNEAEKMMKHMKELVETSNLFTFSYIGFFIAIGIFGIVQIIRHSKYFDTDYNWKGLFLETKEHIIHILIVSLFAFFSKEIIELTITFSDFLYTDSEMFQFFRESAGDLEGVYLANILSLLMITSVIVFVSILQILELLSLFAILLMSPIMIVVALYKPNQLNNFIKTVSRGVLSPMVQTLLIYMVFQFLIPMFSEKGEMSSLYQSVLLAGTLMFSIRNSRLLTDLFIPQKNKTV